MVPVYLELQTRFSWFSELVSASPSPFLSITADSGFLPCLKTLKGANYLRAGSMGGRKGRSLDLHFFTIKLHIMLNIAGDIFNLHTSSGQEPRNWFLSRTTY